MDDVTRSMLSLRYCMLNLHVSLTWVFCYTPRTVASKSI